MNKTQFFKKHLPQGGWLYQTAFDGETEEETFLNLKNFLSNEGFSDIPLPPNSRRLWWDYLRPNHEGIFGNFIWHPIIISQSSYQTNGLVLSIFDETYDNHFELWESTVKKD